MKKLMNELETLNEVNTANEVLTEDAKMGFNAAADKHIELFLAINKLKKLVIEKLIN